MKKYILNLMMLLMAVSTMSLCSCGDDDDDENGGSASFLVGVWTGYVRAAGIQENVSVEFFSEGEVYVQFSSSPGLEKGRYTVNTSAKTITITPLSGSLNGTSSSLVYRYEYERDGDEEELELKSDDVKWELKRIARNGGNIFQIDDNTNTTVTPSNQLVGTWRHSFSTGYVEITFNSDGTGRQYEYDSSDRGHEYSIDEFSYSFDGRYVTVRYDDGDKSIIQILSLSATKLVMMSSDGYTEEYTKR